MKENLSKFLTEDVDLSWFAVLFVPVLMLFLDFIFGVWGWGLMDDFTVLSIGNDGWDRFINYFRATLDFGQFKPFYALFTGFAYSVFETQPSNLYIAKLLFSVVVLLIWGWVSYRISGRRTAIFLLPAITLSFHYFYDVFFYLSSHEIVGLFFLGISLIFYERCYGGILRSGSGVSDQSYITCGAGTLFLFFAFLSKEPFVSSGIAIAGSLLWLSFIKRGTPLFKFLFVSGCLILFVTVLHGVFLNVVIKKQYTSAYSLTNSGKILSNVRSWFLKDFSNHLPWVLVAGYVHYFFKKNTSQNDFRKDMVILWGCVLAGLLYFTYLLILLPWLTTVYYAAPFGLFFAFGITLFIVNKLQYLPKLARQAIILMALVMNVFVCKYALARESVYQYDTQRLLSWVNEKRFPSNSNYKRDFALCNAMEPSDAIPKLVNRLWGSDLPMFKFSTDPNQLLNGKKQDYFIYSPRFAYVDLGILDDDWQKIFISENWTIYRRIKP